MKIWNLGYPRIGRRRDLKKALESYWSNESSIEDLKEAATKICSNRWVRQQEQGAESIPVNDFSFYDQMLDMTWLLGAVADRFKKIPKTHWLDQYFSMARGYRDASHNVAALDMTKWFNTNYHYLVPEIGANTQFKLQTEKLFWELDLAAKHPELSFHAVLIGPWTYVKLSQLTGIDPETVLTKILPLYREVLSELKRRKFEWVQLDEPALCADLTKEELGLVERAYQTLQGAGPSVLLATYFESPSPFHREIAALPVEALHFDLVHGPENLPWLKSKAFPKNKSLSLGVVNGRNLWAASLKTVRDQVKEVIAANPGVSVWLAPSCSLLHLPHDKNQEKQWDSEFLSWVSFADQRLEELQVLKRSLAGDKAADSFVEERERVLNAKQNSPRVHRPEVKTAVEKIDEKMKSRRSPFNVRIEKQAAHLKLPLLPTTTIGSFPQTSEIRKVRLDWKKGKITSADYKKFVEKEIERVIRLQERLDLDVLVHGESERNDMVEYFGELLEGFSFSEYGWVQSYGSRCVKPPILFGDVKRKGPMTVDWFKYSQSLTSKPVKGMLTGPVTILNWSFVREDQSREKTTYQIALAIRDEVSDLERAGAKIIQIDEAAIREGLPIKRKNWKEYMGWATDSFRVSASAVQDETQIQTHMCYSEFADMMDSIRNLDADVLLIENARSGSTFSSCFKREPYRNQIGPGVYDIHSPRVPTVEDCQASLRNVLELFPPTQIWVNPDCGLKTRKYEEVEGALTHMVQGTKAVRAELQKKA